MKNKQFSGMLLAATLLAGSTGLAQAKDWTFPVNNRVDGKNVAATWTGLSSASVTKPWNICVLFPHVKDPLWVAADYGVTDEAKRLGVGVNLYEAGGYGNLSTQLNQFDDCIAQKADAIIIGSISSDGANALIRKAESQGIPVIDLINGVTEPTTAAHAVVSYYDAAAIVGAHIVQESQGKQVNIGYFPGPEGATFADDAVRGLQDSIAGAKNVKLEVVKRGDTGLNVQLNLIQDALEAYPDLNYIVGVDIAAQAAGVAIRNANLTGKVKVAAYTIIPSVYSDITHGVADGAVVDFVPIQGRMSVDMAVMLLQKMPLPAKISGPQMLYLTKANMGSITPDDVFAPKGFHPVFQVAAK